MTTVRAYGLYLARRLLTTVGLALVLSVIVYGLMYLAPGDLVRNLLGTRPATAETTAQIRADYHLDEPFPLQYWHWLTSSLSGDLGTSIRTGSSVTSALADHAGTTLALVAFAFVLSVLVGVPAGVLAAARRGRPSDRLVVGVSVVGVSAPGFATGLILLYVFASGLGWFPLYGPGSGFLDGIWHLALPSVALALGLGAFVVKLTRAAVLRELGEDYVMFARGRGLSRGRVWSILLRNAGIPIVTSLGLMVAYLFGGTVLVEVTFALPGLGSLLEDSVTFKDFPVVQALTVVTVLIVSITGLLVDLAYLAIDPRVRARTVQP